MSYLRAVAEVISDIIQLLQNVRLPVTRSVGKAETPVMSASAHSYSAPCNIPERRHVNDAHHWIQRVPPDNPERAQGSNSLRVLWP